MLSGDSTCVCCDFDDDGLGGETALGALGADMRGGG